MNYTSPAGRSPAPTAPAPSAPAALSAPASPSASPPMTASSECAASGPAAPAGGGSTSAAATARAEPTRAASASTAPADDAADADLASARPRSVASSAPAGTGAGAGAASAAGASAAASAAPGGAPPGGASPAGSPPPGAAAAGDDAPPAAADEPPPERNEGRRLKRPRAKEAAPARAGAGAAAAAAPSAPYAASAGATAAASASLHVEKALAAPPGLPGRGGAVVFADAAGASLLAHGGADRSGALFGDVVRLALAPGGCSARAGGGAPRLERAGERAVDARSGLPLPNFGGHAGARLSGGAALVFGGVDFGSLRVHAGLTELDAAGRWRALGGAPDDGGGGGGGGGRRAAGGGGGGARASARAATATGEPRLVRGAALPGGRTGHSLSAVPPPVVLPALRGGDADEGAEGRAAAAAAAAAAAVPLSSVLGGGAPTAVLFGGSSPEGGPLNDVWLVAQTGEEGGGGGGRGDGAAPDGGGGGAGPDAARPDVAGAGERAGRGRRDAVWAWRELSAARGGPQPAPRELHAAWVRPAVVRAVDDGAPGGDGHAPAPERARMRVRVLQPPALVVYGGRGVDGAAMGDVAVLPLIGRAAAASTGDDAPEGGADAGAEGAPAWTLVPRPRGAPGGHAAAAAAPSPSGLSLLVFGGLTGAGELSARMWALDASNGVELADTAGAAAAVDAGRAAAERDPPPLEPALWTWRSLPLAPAGGAPRRGGAAPADGDDDGLPARFAAAAAALPACARGCCGARVLVFGGMTPLDDLAGGTLFALPPGVP